MWTRPVGLGNEKQATSSCWGVRREHAFEGTGAEPVENGIPENSQMCGLTERGGYPSEPEPVLQDRKLREMEWLARGLTTLGKSLNENPDVPRGGWLL